jgi:hypothetical protein
LWFLPCVINDMKYFQFVAAVFVLVVSAAFLALLGEAHGAMRAGASTPPATRSYLGFDRNEYPGDEAMKTLRRDFAFTSFWLSPPPGDKTNKNTWTGKREFLRGQDFGFVVLYRGRDARELKNEAVAKQKGTLDARNAASSAKTEGFSAGTIIFLDIEDGGRLPATYHAYLRAFADELAGTKYRAGVYCSGIPVKEGAGVTITTAEDIRTSEAPREFTLWAYNDACPPSPGCVFPQEPPTPVASGISAAKVWQFAQSPRRKEFAAHCPPGYHTDGNCYAPSDTAHAWFLDVNSSSSPDPSGSK